jgi:hypothetical protein
MRAAAIHPGAAHKVHSDDRTTFSFTVMPA